MGARTKIDVSPPVLRGMKELDRDAFKKTVPVLGAKVPKQMVNPVRSAAEVRKCVDAYAEAIRVSLTPLRAVLEIPRYPAVRPADDDEHRLLLLDAQSEGADHLPFMPPAYGAQSLVS